MCVKKQGKAGPTVGYARSQNRRRRRRDLVVNGELGWWERLLETEGEEDHRAGDGHGGRNGHPLRAYH